MESFDGVRITALDTLTESEFKRFTDENHYRETPFIYMDRIIYANTTTYCFVRTTNTADGHLRYAHSIPIARCDDDISRRVFEPRE